MWWLDPGKEVLNVVRITSNVSYNLSLSSTPQLFNRILAPYVENLDMNQVNYGIGQGQLILPFFCYPRKHRVIYRSIDVAELAPQKGCS